MTDIPELKPCPFCGGSEQSFLPPTLKQNGKFKADDRSFPIVRCRGCYSDIQGIAWDHSCRTAIKRWNTRADLATDQSALIAELVGALRVSRVIVSDACETGFNGQSGDWAERLFSHNGKISAALAKAKAAGYGGGE